MQTTTMWECATDCLTKALMGTMHDNPLSHGESLREAERTGNSKNNENLELPPR